MAYMIMTATLSLPFISTKPPLKGADIPFKRAPKSVGSTGLYGWLSKLWSLLGPLNTRCRIMLRTPKSGHHFDNHPYDSSISPVISLQSALKQPHSISPKPFDGALYYDPSTDIILYYTIPYYHPPLKGPRL